MNAITILTITHSCYNSHLECRFDFQIKLIINDASYLLYMHNTECLYRIYIKTRPIITSSCGHLLIKSQIRYQNQNRYKLIKVFVEKSTLPTMILETKQITKPIRFKIANILCMSF